MLRIGFLCVCMFVCWTAVDAEVKTLGLLQGDVCKAEGGKLWTCKYHTKCPTLKRNLQRKERPAICSLWAPKDPVVCCEPEDEVDPTFGAKSREMCKKYSEYVKINITHPLGKGVVDTCAAVDEPLPVANTSNTEAAPREFPHMALLGYNVSEKMTWFCSGSLISERFVVGTAHCSSTTRYSTKWVRLGEYNYESKSDEESGTAQPTDYEIIESITHPEYKPPSIYNDIALYKLDRDVVFNAFIRPICLHLDHLFPNTYASVSGWGREKFGGPIVSTLHKANLTITSRRKCTAGVQKAVTSGVNLDSDTGLRDEAMVCTAQDPCQTSLSGSALHIRLKDPYCMYGLVGSIAFGGVCESGNPVAYTRVSYFVPWIESVVWPSVK